VLALVKHKLPCGLKLSTSVNGKTGQSPERRLEIFAKTFSHGIF